MKMKMTLLAAILVIGFGGNILAQVPNDCYETLSLFVEPAKAKNYNGALEHYEKVVSECPKFSLATYQYGAKMFSHFVKNGDKTKVNDLIKSYEDRMAYFPPSELASPGLMFISSFQTLITFVFLEFV